MRIKRPNKCVSIDPCDKDGDVKQEMAFTSIVQQCACWDCLGVGTLAQMYQTIYLPAIKVSLTLESEDTFKLD